MHRPTPRRTPIFRFLLPAALLVAACDRGDELETPEALDDRTAEAAPAADADGPPAEHARHHGKRKKLDRLCERVDCTDEQRTKIEGLADRLWAERPGPSGDRDAANRALAQAFAGDGLSAADLQAFHAAAGPDGDERDALLVEAAGELHGILDAGQRAKLADEIERRGLPFVGGRGPRHRGAHDDERAAKLTERLCGAIACTEDQRARIAGLVAALPEPGQVPQAEREALARAFAGESLSDEVVSAYLDAAKQVRAADLAAVDAKVVELHDLLTPQQRATLAERIADDGPRALGLWGKGPHDGKGRGGKQGRGGKKGKQGRHGKGPRGEAQQLG